MDSRDVKIVDTRSENMCWELCVSRLSTPQMPVLSLLTLLSLLLAKSRAELSADVGICA